MTTEAVTEPTEEPPIEDVLDEFVPEWREGNLSGDEVVALFRERAMEQMDSLLDTYNSLKDREL